MVLYWLKLFNITMVTIGFNIIPSKNEWDLANRHLSKLLELLDTQVEGSVQWVLLEISWNHCYFLHVTVNIVFAFFMVSHSQGDLPTASPPPASPTKRMIPPAVSLKPRTNARNSKHWQGFWDAQLILVEQIYIIIYGKYIYMSK